MRVLVVDDSLIIRNQVGKALAGKGYTCDFAENGIEALRHALQERYDVILTDVTMPLLDGLKFIARVRAGGKSANSPILILSSRVDEEAVYRARDLGIQGYVLKPCTPEDLLARVEDARARATPSEG